MAILRRALVIATLVAFSCCIDTAFASGGKHLRNDLSENGDMMTPRELQTTRSVPFDIGALEYDDYYDTTENHYGNCDRDRPVDAKNINDAVCLSRGASCTVGWSKPTEWLSYDFGVPQATTVDITVRASSGNPSKRFSATVDGMTNTWNSPGEGYDNFMDLKWENVQLAAGDHSLRLSFINGNINVCSVSVQASSLEGATPQPTPPAPAPTPPTTTGPPTPFRIKLWWQLGYFWQEESFERLWCLQCDSPVCQEADYARLRVCDNSTTVTPSNTLFEFIPTTAVPGQVQIKDSATNMCLTTENYTVDKINTRMRVCDNTNSGQFWSSSGGDFSSLDKLEVHPQSDSNYCLTQHHFPKDGEDARVERCRLARKDDSSYWIRYYPF